MTAKTKIIISDLHLGAGLEGAGGNRLEDFISDIDFVEWVHGLTAESNRTGADMEFIINGDFMEMLQVPAVVRFDPTEPYPPAAYAANDEASALLKLTHITQGHPGLFAVLADFISHQPRRNVVILRGNHDPELYWPGVQDVLRHLLGATGEVVNLLQFPPLSYLTDGVYVEHGNQYTESVNRFQNPSAPLDPQDPTRLELVWGSRFVFEYFNQIERERYWVDGVAPMTGLIWYGLHYDFPFAARALKLLLAAVPRLGLPREVSPKQIDAISALEADLADPDDLPALQARYESDRAFRQEFEARVLEALRDVSTDDTLLPSARDLTPAAALARAEQLADEYRRRLRSEAQRIATETQARLVTFGHTHVSETFPLADGATYINSGAWIGAADFSHATPAQWEDLFRHPDAYANQRQLAFVRVDYDAAGQLSARLLHVGQPTPPGGTGSGGVHPAPSPHKGCLPALLLLPFRR
ncbi:hypothetical protein [Candidatus Amarolinea dominans]|uniref:hypothetical protein n=1 Tax=Candidatus Amarolinea dominans TaxID=3140696 RepID=UPI001DE7133F|nr:metallophosphoesterase [Anaerolineae bacterium]